MGKRQKAAGLTWSIRVTRVALAMLENIRDAKTRAGAIKVIDGLSVDPEAQGKALVGSLAGYRSIRAAGQRYRIIYKAESAKITVYVVAAGIRKEGDNADIYELARKLVGIFKKRAR